MKRLKTQIGTEPTSEVDKEAEYEKKLVRQFNLIEEKFIEAENYSISLTKMLTDWVDSAEKFKHRANIALLLIKSKGMVKL